VFICKVFDSDYSQGRSVTTSTHLPSFTNHPDFRFGMSTVEDESAKVLIHPEPPKKTDDDEKVRRQYLLSHASYQPGCLFVFYRPFSFLIMKYR
jgi:hypothetical protein